LIYFWIILTLCLISSTNDTIDTPVYSIVPDTTVKKQPKKIDEKKVLMEQKAQTKELKNKDMKLDTLLKKLEIDTNKRQY